MPIEGAPPIDNGMDRVHAVIATALLASGVALGNVIALVVGAVAALVLVAARSDYARYSVVDVGRYERMQNRGVHDAGESCDICDGVADGGEEARRFTELVVAGIVLRRYNIRSRYYCAEHGGVAVTNDLTRQTGQRLQSASADEIED